MNSKGFSWSEVLFAATVVFVIFSSLFPFSHIMLRTLDDKKQAMYAARTAHQAAIYYQNNLKTNGIDWLEGYKYEWIVNAHTICVSYKTRAEEKEQCFG